MKDKHASRIELFNSTLAILRQGWYISKSGKKIDLPSADEVIASAAMYSEPLHTLIDPVAPIQTEVRVENDDCVLVAKRLIDEGYNPAMLNLADLYTPGGLVEYGSGAQEENLCRRSNLILSLYRFSSSRIRQYPDLGMTEQADQYPMDERFGGVYSGIVTFFRGPESEGSLLEDTPYNIPVISVAALSGPRIGADGLMLPEESVAQNIDRLFFAANGELQNEFENLYRSLFKRAGDHITIVSAMATKAKGLTRKEVLELTQLNNNLKFTKTLEELEKCGFIRTYVPFGKAKRDALFQLTDAFTLFHFHFANENKYQDEFFWTHSLNSPRYRAWSGYAFEMLCLNHIAQIKQALGISGIQSRASLHDL